VLGDHPQRAQQGLQDPIDLSVDDRASRADERVSTTPDGMQRARSGAAMPC
jgi:hypothetical protein